MHVCLSVCLSSAVRVQGEKHQEEKSQPCGVCRRRESQLEEKEKGEWPFWLNLLTAPYVNPDLGSGEVSCFASVSSMTSCHGDACLSLFLNRSDIF